MDFAQYSHLSAISRLNLYHFSWVVHALWWSMLYVCMCMYVGLFVDELVVVARKELAWETDYTREAKCQNIFRSARMHSDCSQ